MNELAPRAEPANLRDLGHASGPLSAPVDGAAPSTGWGQPPRPRRMPTRPPLAVQPTVVQPATANETPANVGHRHPSSRETKPRRPSQDGSRDVAGWATLTAAELMVTRLVAEGMSNRAVSAALVISPHTVSSHLRSVFNKLDVRTRAQLTRLVVQHELPHPGSVDPSRRRQEKYVSDDGALLQQVHDLVAREHQLRDLLAERDDPDRSQHRAALERVEEELDQCWDLLRQRRARRANDQDPDQAQVRPVSQVEGYLPRARDGR